MSFTLSRTRISTVVVVIVTAIISADTHELYYIMYTQQRLPTRDIRNAHRRI